MKDPETLAELRDWNDYRTLIKERLKLLGADRMPCFISKEKFDFEVQGKPWNGRAVLLGPKARAATLKLLSEGLPFRPGVCLKRGKELRVEGLPSKLVMEADKTLVKLMVGYRAAHQGPEVPDEEPASPAGNGAASSPLEERWRMYKARVMPRLQAKLQSGPAGNERLHELARLLTEQERAGDFAAAIKSLERIVPFLDGVSAGASKPGKPQPPADVRAVLNRATPMPDSAGLKYYTGIPTADGGFEPDQGGSRAIRLWAQRFEQGQDAFGEQQLRLNSSTTALRGTLKEARERLAKAVHKDIPDGLKKLQKKSGGQAFTLIKEYHQAGIGVTGANAKLQAARDGVTGALAGHSAAGKALEGFQHQAQKQSAEEQLERLQKSVAERASLIGKLVDTGVAIGSGNAKGAAIALGSDLIQQILGGMTGAEQREAIKLEYQIEHLEQSIARLGEGERRDQLNKAKAELSERFNQLLAAQIELQLHQRRQRDAIEQLGSLEEIHGVTTLFGELKEFDADVRHDAQELLDRTDGYISKLQTPDLAKTVELRYRIEDDMEVARHRGVDEKDPWFQQARDLDSYLYKQNEWRLEELGNQQRARKALMERQHLAPLDQVMALADRGLGGTSSD